MSDGRDVIAVRKMSKRNVPRYQREADTGPTIPPPSSDRIPADLSQQAPHNSYGGVPLYYEDQPFTCVDCGKEEIWTAEQQKWWYEVAKASIYSRAVRCHDCRRARREGGPQPQPIRHVGTLMKLLRAQLDPALADAGFVFASRSKPVQPSERVWIDYGRSGQTFSIAFEPRDARLIAELLEPNGDCRTVTAVAFDGPTSRAEVMATIEEFAAAVTAFLRSDSSGG